jgi:hypothetical protein
MNKTLLPCPFCGGKARWMYLKPIGRVMCKKCGASSAALSDNYEEADCQQEAIAAWNSRTSKDINVITNADRIRSMNDEELARFLGDEPPYLSTYDKYLEWLRQPAKEANNGN